MPSSPLLAASPSHHTAPDWSVTLGPEVGDLCREVGFAPFPEQQLCLDDMFALKSGGKAAAFEFAIVCARQNMKTGLFKQASLGWLFVTGQDLIIWSAHEFATAQEAFRDMEILIEGSDMLRRRVKKVSRGNGDEAIELVTGQRLKFKARTNGGGRGLTGDKVVLDEAFALKPEHMGALLPTLTAVPDPQVVYGSSAGLIQSDILRGIRDRGRPGSEGLAYAEWCAEKRPCADEACGHVVGTPGCALDDVGLWQQANPVIVRRDPSLSAIRRNRNALPPSEFMRECLGWWDDPEDSTRGGLSPERWAACEDQASHRAGAVAFGVAQSPDRSTVCIAAAGRREDGLYHVELIEQRRGTTWVADRLAELVDKHAPVAVVVDPAAPAGALVGDFEARGVQVSEIGVADLARTCGLLHDLVESEQVRHVGQHPLSSAAESVGIRTLTRGGWLWKQASEVSIEPINAVTLALWGLDAQDEPFVV